MFHDHTHFDSTSPNSPGDQQLTASQFVERILPVVRAEAGFTALERQDTTLHGYVADLQQACERILDGQIEVNGVRLPSQDDAASTAGGGCISGRQAHWRIFKDAASDSMFPWHYEHTHSADDPHFTQDHDYGSVSTFQDAVAMINDASWKECGLALAEVPFYGLELGIDAPNGERTCAFDVSGFRHLEQATTYAESLREMPAQQAMNRAEHDGHIVSPMDAEKGDLHLPLVGATAYLYDPEDGTVWNDDLRFWESRC